MKTMECDCAIYKDSGQTRPRPSSTGVFIVLVKERLGSIDTAETSINPGGCPCRSKSSLSAHTPTGLQ